MNNNNSTFLSERVSSGPVSGVKIFEKMNKKNIVRNNEKENLQEELKTETMCSGIIRKQYLYRHKKTNHLYFSDILLNNNNCDEYIGEKEEVTSNYLRRFSEKKPRKINKSTSLGVGNKVFYLTIGNGRKFSFSLQYFKKIKYYSSLINNIEYIIIHDKENTNKIKLYMIFNDCLLQVNTLYL